VADPWSKGRAIRAQLVRSTRHFTAPEGSEIVESRPGRGGGQALAVAHPQGSVAGLTGVCSWEVGAEREELATGPTNWVRREVSRDDPAPALFEYTKRVHAE
jgi:hypothetical protein